MLLNQCLAISLSPIVTDKGQQEEEDVNYAFKQDKIEWDLFRQLVKENSLKLNVCDGEALREALERVEFAGFVVPNWLLLSGSHKDLSCIKSNWSDGSLKAPIGFKVDTMGNIRSVNVDYSHDDSNKQQSNAREHYEAEGEGDWKRNNSNKLSKPQNSYKSTGIGPKFAPLNAAILSSLNELSAHQNSVNVHQLIEHLSSRFSNQIDLPPVEFIDCAINGLARSGRLKLKPMTQEEMRSCLISSNKGAIQSVFLDQLIEIGDPTTTTKSNNQDNFMSNRSLQSSRVSNGVKSKSTTLDSGIQSWDLLSNPTLTSEDSEKDRGHDIEQVVERDKVSASLQSTSAGKRSFSLSRSLSFKNWPTKKQAAMAPSTTNDNKQRAANRCWQTHPTINGQQEVETTTTTTRSGQKVFASNLSNLFRSKSMRTISSGTSKEKRIDDAKYTTNCCWHSPDSKRSPNNNQRQAIIDYLTTAQPHKRSLSMRHNRPDTSEQIGGGAKLVLFLRKLFGSRRRSQVGVAEPLDEQASVSLSSVSPSRSSNNSSSSRSIAEPRKQRNAEGAALNSTSSSNSSNASSLIQILDCSPALASSRRPLREEPATPLREQASQARSWRLLEERDSQSSVSQNSLASCSTTKSTVSQQLICHLDEAYKRHRGSCTSQREKDFIDSINVLRQASRHAYQAGSGSRASSKSRRGAGSRSVENEAKQVVSSDTGSTSCSSRSSQCLVQEKCQCNKKPLNNYHHLDLMAADSLNEDLQLNNMDTNCVYCTYLASNCRLTNCPLPTCCAHLTTCCLPDQFHQNHAHPPEADLCCPLWRSMLYNYCPPLYYSPEFERFSGAKKQVSEQEEQQQQQKQVNFQQDQQQTNEQLKRFENFSSRQHHNTTIDLKIEIGADFKQQVKQLTRSGSIRLLEQANTDDSLDDRSSVSDQTDESLVEPNIKRLQQQKERRIQLRSELFERDSCESDFKSDSLR